MQEEVEQRIVSLMISCGKLGEQEFRKAVAKLLEQLKNGHQKHQYSKANPHGKMTVKQLAAKDKGLQSIEVTDQNIGSFNRIARKYGIFCVILSRGFNGSFKCYHLQSAPLQGRNTRRSVQCRYSGGLCVFFSGPPSSAVK